MKASSAHKGCARYRPWRLSVPLKIGGMRGVDPASRRTIGIRFTKRAQLSQL
jgi:hypothetical protein